MMARGAPTGADVDLSAWAALPLRALLFGEAQGRIVLSTRDAEQVLATASQHGVPARVIGRVTTAADGLSIRVGERVMRASVESLAASFHEAIPGIMARSAAAAGAADESFQDN